MVYKKSYKKKAVKKYAKKPVTTVWKNNVTMGKGFPKKICMTHKYNEVQTHTSNSGTPGFFKYVCNGMYDPNNTGVGGQPYYFDQMSAIYDHYTVIGSKITVKVVPVTVPAVAFRISLSQNDDATQTNNTVSGTAEQSSGSVFIFPAGATDTVKSLTNRWSAKKTFGGSVLGNDNLQGSISANPSELTIWSVGIQAMDTISTISVYLEINIEYIAIWEEIKDIAQS